MKHALIAVMMLCACGENKDEFSECKKDCCNYVEASPNPKSMKKDSALTCKLTSPELRERKATVIADLTTRLVKRAELENGFSYYFDAGDETIDLLGDFVKSERQCCDFFDFAIKVTADETRLDITGPDGVKEFIVSELEF